ncbi:hypothetical protein OFDDKENP_00024 [Aeromonas phage B614]|nr:hypothetical protein OFDDKENP_00024 [Aeromonas phage B614]UYD58233.1 hypothetical protein JNEOFJEA_00154 [Aeromonas phage UP87]UYD58347.1 hypothetical protein IPAKJDPM_00004 [Aeromonas phage avDM14-QBC]UYD58811.1 hypothetical protein HNNIDBEH_00235 [Aeromonas phage avDM10-HWA]UYD58886.1 hypothetical protein OFOPOMKI_00019 [Aeromonas phage avDM7-IJDJ]UYD59946.1 hypothetical protein LEHPIFIF_00173 [Aeromonas phage avDM9-HANS]
MQKQIVLSTGVVLSATARTVAVEVGPEFTTLVKGEGEKRVVIAEVRSGLVDFIVHDPKLLDGEEVAE